MNTKNYKLRTSQHTISLVLKNYSDNNTGVMLVVTFYGAHLIFNQF
jgi:hypothetical protein